MKTKLSRHILLNLGCGTVAPSGWVNIDSSWNAVLSKIPLTRKIISIFLPSLKEVLNVNWSKDILTRDIRKPLPYPNGSVDGIYLSHILEHFDKSTADLILGECFRILRTNGTIRVIVPDLYQYSNMYIRQYEKNTPDSSDNYLKNIHLFSNTNGNVLAKLYFFINNTDSHKWMYDKYSLKAIMTAAGFSSLRICKYLSSRIPDINKVENRDRFKYSVCIEGIKK
jgi:predicted SAM-dependent methyltransferase